jgi:hypothetical protein
VARTPFTSAISALRRIDSVSSPFANASSYQCVVNPDSGSAAIVLSLNENTTSTRIGM